MSDDRRARVLSPRLGLALILAVLPASPCVIAGGGPSPRPPERGEDRDRTYAFGSQGWSLERFGRDIAILRADVTPSPPETGPAGLIFLSCAASERRWRLSLPARFLSDEAATILVRPSGAGGDTDLARIGRVRIEDGRVLTLAEHGSSPGAFVPGFLRLLMTDAARLDLLVRTDAGPKRAGLLRPSLPAHIFSIILRPTDRLAIEDLLATCDPAPR